MTTYLSFQSIVSYRVPLKDDGSIGTPEVTSKFTRPVKGAKDYNRKPVKPLVTNLVTENIEEGEY